MIPKKLIRKGDLITTKRGYTGRVTRLLAVGLLLDNRVLVEKMNYVRRWVCTRTGSVFLNDWNVDKIYEVGSKYDKETDNSDSAGIKRYSRR